MKRAPRPSFDPATIGAEIERVRETREVGVKEAADIIRINRTLWYKKRDAKGSRFFPHEIEKLAEAWGAPSTWPYLPWELAEAFDAWRRGEKPRQ